MGREKEEQEIRKQLAAQFEAMYEELYQWREKHAEASFDEIGDQITPRRQELMGELMVQLARQHGSGEVIEGIVCEKCGRLMEYKGEPKRDVEHLEGKAELYRAYYYCPHCEGGFFPPGSTTGVSGPGMDAGDDQAGAASGDTDTIVPASGRNLRSTDEDTDVKEQYAGIGERIRGLCG